MSVLGSLFAATTISTSDLRNPRLWLQSWHDNGSLGVPAASESESNGIPAYWGCIRNIAEDVAKLPFLTYERLPDRENGKDGGKRRAVDHPVFSILHDEASTTMDAFCLREQLTKDALGYGNGIAVIQRDGADRPTGLEWVHPSNLANIALDRTGRVIYELHVDPELNDGEHRLVFDQSDIFHLKGVGNGLVGTSVLRAHASTLGMTLETQKMGLSLFKSGIRPSGIIKYTKGLSEDAKSRLLGDWRRMHEGGDEKMKLALLEDGFDFQQLTIPPEEAQFLETRSFQVVELARIFRMPPHKIQHLADATFSNIEQQSIEYVVDTLGPWLLRWEKEASRKLFDERERPRFFAEHLVEGLLRGDSAARSAFYTAMFDRGVMSQNEIRSRENLNPIDHGDDYWVPLNMQRLGDEDDEKNPGSAPPTRQTEQRGEEEDEADEPQEDDGNEEGEQPEAVLLLPVVVDAFTRAAARESKALARAEKRHDGDASGLEGWANRFYLEHDEFLRAALEATQLPLATLSGRSEVEIENRTRAHTSAFCDLRRDDVLAGAALAKLGQRAMDEAPSDAAAYMTEVTR